MYNKQPKLKVPRSSLDFILDYLTLGILLFIWLFVFYHYGRLPEIIPVHMNLEGEIDAHGSKGIIWLLPTLASLIIGALFWLIQYPHIFNYHIKITVDNAIQEYRSAIRVLRFVNMLCALLFFLIAVDLVLSARHKMSFLSEWVFVVLLLLIMFPAIVSLYKIKRKKQAV